MDVRAIAEVLSSPSSAECGVSVPAEPWAGWDAYLILQNEGKFSKNVNAEYEYNTIKWTF